MVYSKTQEFYLAEMRNTTKSFIYGSRFLDTDSNGTSRMRSRSTDQYIATFGCVQLNISRKTQFSANKNVLSQTELSYKYDGLVLSVTFMVSRLASLQESDEILQRKQTSRCLYIKQETILPISIYLALVLNLFHAWHEKPHLKTYSRPLDWIYLMFNNYQ